MTKKQSEKDLLTVNRQITDAITQSNLIATGMSAANSLGTLYQTLAQSTGASLQNAVAHQQHVNTLNLATLSKNVEIILQPQGSRSKVQTLQPIIVQQPAPAEKKTPGSTTPR